jgi:hypothetical protein
MNISYVMKPTSKKTFYLFSLKMTPSSDSPFDTATHTALALTCRVVRGLWIQLDRTNVMKSCSWGGMERGHITLKDLKQK